MTVSCATLIIGLSATPHLAQISYTPHRSVTEVETAKGLFGVSISLRGTIFGGAKGIAVTLDGLLSK